MDLVSATTPGWVEGVIVPPGPTGGGGDGAHDVDLSGSLAPEYAVVGVVGVLVIATATFVIAARRRLRRARPGRPRPRA